MDSEAFSDLDTAIDQIEDWLTQQDDFRDVSRGTPLPHELPESTKREKGMTRELKLEVISDPSTQPDCVPHCQLKRVPRWPSNST